MPSVTRTSLYPSPRTVTSRSGFEASRSIFRRRFEMCTSHACSSPTCSLAQRCCISSRRDTTLSGCSASSASTLNSDSVRWTRSPSTSTSWRPRSMCRPPRRAHRRAAVHAVELAPPQDRAHAAQQLRRRERLRHVVVRAELEPEHAVDLGVARGEHQDRHVALGPQRTADVGAGESRAASRRGSRCRSSAPAPPRGRRRRRAARRRRSPRAAA